MSAPSKREVTACPNCGSTELGVPPTNVDAFIGAAALDGRMYCKGCGREGLPILFDSVDDYKRFLSNVKEGGAERSVDSSTIVVLGEQKRKKPAAAALFSFFVPGLGHAYAGGPLKGVVLFILTFLVGAYAGNLILPFLLLLAADAYYDAKRYNTNV
jgi:TM2 domain-containing membrane protein YozV